MNNLSPELSIRYCDFGTKENRNAQRESNKQAEKLQKELFSSVDALHLLENTWRKWIT